ncbi:hypothetical protein Tco_0015158 [Tanacetum coccineum]
MGPLMSTGKPLTQEEAEREALAISICERYSLLEEERSALIEKEDPRAFVIPIRLEGKINLNALADTRSDINVMPYRVYKELGREEVGVTTIIAKFLILDMPIDRDTPILVGRGFLYTCGRILNTIERITSTFDGICHQMFRAAKTSLDTAESDSDDEEEYAIQRNKFGAPIYRTKPAKYLNCHDPLDRSLALQEVLNPFRKIYVWKKVVSFLGSLPVALQHVDWKPDYAGCFNRKEDSAGQWHAKIKLTNPYGNIFDQAMLPRVHHPFLLWEGCNQATKSRYNTRLAQLLSRLIYSPCVVDWNVLNQMGCGKAIDEMLTIKLFVAGTNEEIFTSEAWTNAFNIDERIYCELCHEFCSTYEFDEVCAADVLKTKKIIKFRLCGHAFSWTLLEFAKRLGLYNSVKIEEEGFDVYFQGGLRSDEHFNAQDDMDEEERSRALDTTTLKEWINSEGRLIRQAVLSLGQYYQQYPPQQQPDDDDE